MGNKGAERQEDYDTCVNDGASFELCPAAPLKSGKDNWKVAEDIVVNTIRNGKRDQKREGNKTNLG